MWNEEQSLELYISDNMYTPIWYGLLLNGSYKR